MFPGRDPEDLIQLLQRQRLRLGHEQQDADPADHAPGRIPPEGALILEGTLQRRPSEGEDEVEAPRRRGGEAHADLADVQRERLGAVGEGDGAHAGGVEDFEEVHPRGHHGDFLNVGEPEGEADPEQEDAEQRERDEEEIAAAEGVDGEEGGEGKDPVQDACAHGREEGGGLGVLCFQEDGGGVVGDDVDAAELLHEHQDPGGPRRAAVSRHREEFPDHVAAGGGLALDLDVDVAVVEVAGSLDLGGAQP